MWWPLCQNFCQFQEFLRRVISFQGLFGGEIKFQEFPGLRSKFKEFPEVRSKFHEFSKTLAIPGASRNPRKFSSMGYFLAPNAKLTLPEENTRCSPNANHLSNVAGPKFHAIWFHQKVKPTSFFVPYHLCTFRCCSAIQIWP